MSKQTDFFCCLFAFLLAGSTGLAAEEVSLRGYGKVSATLSPTRSEFICESQEKAEILLGKLLADLFWDAGSVHLEKNVTVGGIAFAVHSFPPYGWIAVGRDHHRVVVVGADDEPGIALLGAKESVFQSPDVVFKPLKPYPMFLDFYDLRAWKSATTGLGARNKYQNDERMAFVKKFCNGGLMGGILYRDSASSGVHPDLSIIDTDVDLAEKEGMMYSMILGSSIMPVWARNQWPQFVDRDSPESPADTFHGSYFGAAQSLGIPAAEQARLGLAFQNEIMSRYKSRNHLGGYELYCGDYIFEAFYAKNRTGHLGYTPVGQAAFRRWLSEERKLTLRQLGERWHGDPSHFKSWDEVTLPEDLNQFFGKLDDGCFRIHTNWAWIKAGKDLENLPEESAEGWIAAENANSRTTFLTVNQKSEPAFWKAGFNPAVWLAKNAGKEIYLVMNLNNPGWREYQVWLNGTRLGKFKSVVSPYDGPISIAVTGLLERGDNQLAVSTPGGKIRGPVFLTTTKPAAYPYLGALQNARYLDLIDWQSYALNSLVERAMASGRGVDPDRPYVLAATGLMVKDGQGELLARFGGSMQDTGYESSFRPFNSRMGYAAGFYGSCEPGGYIPTKSPENIVETRMLGWMLFNGESHFRMTGEACDFFEIEQKTGWLARNHRAIDLIGKALPEKPEIAIFHSSRNNLLGEAFHSLNWDIGRGELPAAHYDFVYVTESILSKGLADDYPVLFDSDSIFLSAETIQDLRAYVEKGGTFIATHQTGMHDLLEPETWPISKLTGFKVNAAGRKGTITFEKQLPIFRGWEGKTFEGEGTALNFKDEESAKGVGASLSPDGSGAVPLARWDDGTVAVGMRSLGKGRVIVLASTFWRSGRDLGGLGLGRIQDLQGAFFERLFTDLSVKRTATASDSRAYARKMISKNGLQEWVVCANTLPDPLTVQVEFATGQNPDQLWDLVEQRPVPFVVKDGWVSIKGVTLPAFGARVFAIKRASLSSGIDFWWKEKKKFWKNTSPPPAPENLSTHATPPTAISFESWKFYADREDALGKNTDWTAPVFVDSSWRTLDNKPWNFQYDDLKSYGGIGLYRSRPFILPAAWKGKKVSVNILPPWGGAYKGFELFLNGEALPGILKPDRKADITAKMRPDNNVLSIKLTGTMPLSGLIGFAIWIQPEIALEPAFSLLGEWEALHLDPRNREKAMLVGIDRASVNSGFLVDSSGRRLQEETAILQNHFAAKAYRLAREFKVPGEWRGKNIFLRISTPLMTTQKVPIRGMNNGMVLINDQPIAFPHPPNAPVDEELFNLTPYIQYGEKNRLELWPSTTLDGSGKESLIVLEKIEIGCEAK